MTWIVLTNQSLQHKNPRMRVDRSSVGIFRSTLNGAMPRAVCGAGSVEQVNVDIPRDSEKNRC